MASNEQLGCLREIRPQMVWAPFSKVSEPLRIPEAVPDPRTVPDVGSSGPAAPCLAGVQE